MPIVKINDYLTPYVLYDAPINEKTKQIREKFKVDEKTGYPEHYNWRPLARLGPEYNHLDPFTKLGEYNPDDYISQKVTMVVAVTALGGLLHWFSNYQEGKKIYVGLPRFFGLVGGTIGALLWIHEKTLRRQAQKNDIIIDYVTKHPERFEKIKRPKFRECLFFYAPAR